MHEQGARVREPARLLLALVLAAAGCLATPPLSDRAMYPFAGRTDAATAMHGWRGRAPGALPAASSRSGGAPAARMVLPGAPSLPPPARGRTVIDDERGSIYAPPADGSWSALGAYVGDPKSYAFWQMQPQALKVAQGQFHVLRQSDDTMWSYFPYSKLRAYEAREIAAGRPPIFITATYKGKKRPVVWQWSLALHDPANREYAVNVGDPRYVNFWITNYADPILLHQYYDDHGRPASIAGPYPNEWIGVDESTFNYGDYGVLDDAGHFVSHVQWDAPFPQGRAGMHQMFQRFFAQLKQERPDIHIMANLGSMDDWSYFQSDFANVDGLMVEDLLIAGGSDPGAVARAKFYDHYVAFKWWAAQDRVAILRSRINTSALTAQADMRTSYVAYLIYCGDNFFFAPQSLSTGNEVLPSAYAAMKQALGTPVAPPTDQLDPSATGQGERGYRLYSRRTQGGIVYLNYTGSAQTITLPAGRRYLDHNGVPVTRITIPDLSGDYVTYAG